LSENDEIDITLNLNLDGHTAAYSQMVGGDNRNPMLKNGVVETVQVWNELHPRTGIGYTQDRKTVIFVWLMAVDCQPALQPSNWLN